MKSISKELRKWPKPVLAIHGDSHDYIVDQPLIDERTGKAFAQFTRLEVPGAPQIRLVDVNVDTSQQDVFDIDLFQPKSDEPGWDEAD